MFCFVFLFFFSSARLDVSFGKVPWTHRAKLFVLVLINFLNHYTSTNSFLLNFQNKTDKADFDLREIYCVMGCNDALNLYFQWLKQEIGTPTAPALVADSLTATSLSLEWSVPPKFSQLARTKNYLVQCYEGFEDDWKSCRNQTIGDNSTVRVDNLQPYTKYRVILMISYQKHLEL